MGDARGWDGGPSGMPSPRCIRTTRTPGTRCHSSRSPPVRRVQSLRRGWMPARARGRPCGMGVRFQSLVAGSPERGRPDPRQVRSRFLSRGAPCVSGARISADISFSEAFFCVTACGCCRAPSLESERIFTLTGGNDGQSLTGNDGLWLWTSGAPRCLGHVVDDVERRWC